jgi:D-serine deaminase-like pyridoxal phosphate-dependent protein
MDISQLDTPVPIIDLNCVEANIARMQSHANAHSVALRPHIKTHKLPILARKQLEAGAIGIACQKIGEAEIMAAAGIPDILITYNLVGAAKIERLARIALQTKISVAIDNPVALETLSQAAKIAQTQIGVLIEFDSGNQRTGVQNHSELLELAHTIRAHELLEFGGLMTYPTTPSVAAWVSEARGQLKNAGFELSLISGGGTPAAWNEAALQGITELRPGTYVYNDRQMMAASAATLEQCAINLLVTVVSRPTSNRAVIDAGSKTFSSDQLGINQGYGLVLEYPEAILERINEEHGMLDLSACNHKPQIGEKLRIIPNHACVVTNLHDEIVAHREGKVAAIWQVLARGKTR